jgi:hypothetical protein
MDTATDLFWWARGGVLGHRARRVRRHIFEDSAQPINDVVVVDFTTGHPQRVVDAGVLVPKGVAGHQRLHPSLHEAEGHMFGPQPGFSPHLDLRQQLG